MTNGTLARVLRLAAVLAAGALLMPATRVSAAEDVVATLRVDAAAFWSGAKGVDGRDGSSREYTVRVAQPGGVLRVASDSPVCCYGDLEVVRPDGTRVTARGYMTAEAYVEDAAVGRYIVRVPNYDAESRLRLRARLERPAPPRAARESARRVLPNLRLVPPYEFTFRSGLLGPPSGPGAGCNPDDIAEYGGQRCLRFSLGPANTGPGPFQLRFTELEGVATEGQAYQRVYDTSGRFVERKAGQFLYHKTHAHYHHSGFGSLELFRVTDPARGTMTRAGSGPKQGFCTADVRILEWRSFSQARQNSTPSQCVSDMTPTGTYGPTGTMMGISPGWADIYLWSQDGNYVDFASNPDGRYVVRSTADALGYVLETDERDNTSYAYIDVRGSEVRVLERGFGSGPWDRNKQVANDGLLPNPR